MAYKPCRGLQILLKNNNILCIHPSFKIASIIVQLHATYPCMISSMPKFYTMSGHFKIHTNISCDMVGYDMTLSMQHYNAEHILYSKYNNISCMEQEHSLDFDVGCIWLSTMNEECEDPNFTK